MSREQEPEPNSPSPRREGRLAPVGLTSIRVSKPNSFPTYDKSTLQDGTRMGGLGVGQSDATESVVAAAKKSSEEVQEMSDLANAVANNPTTRGSPASSLEQDTSSLLPSLGTHPRGMWTAAEDAVLLRLASQNFQRNLRGASFNWGVIEKKMKEHWSTTQSAGFTRTRVSLQNRVNRFRAIQEVGLDPVKYSPRAWTAEEDQKLLALTGAHQNHFKKIGIDWVSAVKDFTGRPRFELKDRRETLIALGKKNAFHAPQVEAAFEDRKMVDSAPKGTLAESCSDPGFTSPKPPTPLTLLAIKMEGTSASDLPTEATSNHLLRESTPSKSLAADDAQSVAGSSALESAGQVKESSVVSHQSSPEVDPHATYAHEPNSRSFRRNHPPPQPATLRPSADKPVGLTEVGRVPAAPAARSTAPKRPAASPPSSSLPPKSAKLSESHRVARGEQSRGRVAAVEEPSVFAEGIELLRTLREKWGEETEQAVDNMAEGSEA